LTKAERKQIADELRKAIKKAEDHQPEGYIWLQVLIESLADRIETEWFPEVNQPALPEK